MCEDPFTEMDNFSNLSEPPSANISSQLTNKRQIIPISPGPGARCLHVQMILSYFIFQARMPTLDCTLFCEGIDINQDSWRGSIFICLNALLILLR